MDFLNQNWFWSGLFPVLASVVTIVGTVVTVWMTNRYRLKLERIRLYEVDQFRAYNELYEFISHGYSLWPPSEPKREYSDFMKAYYFKKIKQNMLFYQPRIRELLKELEVQYHSLGDPDRMPEKSFDAFFSEDFLDILNKIEKVIEGKLDEFVHKT